MKLICHFLLCCVGALAISSPALSDEKKTEVISPASKISQRDRDLNKVKDGNYIVAVEDLPYFLKEDLATANPKMVFTESRDSFKSFPHHLIYGNPIVGHVAPDNSDWLEVIVPSEIGPKRGETRETGFVVGEKTMKRLNAAEKIYLPLVNLVKEPDYEKVQVQFQITSDSAKVYLLPDKNSREVLELQKGEVVFSSGKVAVKESVWYRFEFNSTQTWTYRAGPLTSRVGWIEASVLRLLNKADPTSYSLDEIPQTSRYMPAVGVDFYLDKGNLAKNKLFEFDLSSRKQFEKNGFYALRASQIRKNYPVSEMTDRYVAFHCSPGCRVEDDVERGALFITSDFFLNSYHIIFDSMLQSIEKNELLYLVSNLSEGLYKDAEKTYRLTHNTEIRAAAKINMWFFGVGLKLLKSQTVIAPEVVSEVQKEVDLILGVKEMPPSQILPGFVDKYEQYKVRGHYDSESNDLKYYFLVMKHYGNKQFFLGNNLATLSAILITKSLMSENLTHYWNRFNQVINFLVGEPDNWSPAQYKTLIDSVYGKAINDEDLVSKLEAFRQEGIKLLPPQKIHAKKLSYTKLTKEQIKKLGFSFFGQSYLIDTDIFQQLMPPSVGLLSSRNLPTALEIMSVLGSREAFNQIPKEWWTQIERYQESYNESKQMVEKIPKDKWQESSYMAWLQTLSSLLQPSPSTQTFAKSPAWGYKQLNSALGSWTELKHDTLLYALGSGYDGGADCAGDNESCVPAPYAPPIIKGYIEPNPIFFARLYRLVEITLQCLEGSHTKGTLTSTVHGGINLDEEYMSKLNKFIKIIEKAQKIIDKEINNQEITYDDYLEIKNMPGTFDRDLLWPKSQGEQKIQPETQMALIADVATSTNPTNYLLEAIGSPMTLYVLVKDYWGGTRITRGFTYSYYEFENRSLMNDEQWRGKVYNPEKKNGVTKA